jgi:hypothetical protein
VLGDKMWWHIYLKSSSDFNSKSPFMVITLNAVMLMITGREDTREMLMEPAKD